MKKIYEKTVLKKFLNGIYANWSDILKNHLQTVKIYVYEMRSIFDAMLSSVHRVRWSIAGDRTLNVGTK